VLPLMLQHFQQAAMPQQQHHHVPLGYRDVEVPAAVGDTDAPFDQRQPKDLAIAGRRQLDPPQSVAVVEVGGQELAQHALDASQQVGIDRLPGALQVRPNTHLALAGLSHSLDQVRLGFQQDQDRR
jgi:hypothetical protein